MRNTETRKVIFEKTSEVNKRKYENRKAKKVERELIRDCVFARYMKNEKGILEEVFSVDDFAFVIYKAIKLNARFIVSGWIKEKKNFKNQFILVAFTNEDLYVHSKFCNEMGFNIGTIRHPREIAAA